MTNQNYSKLKEKLIEKAKRIALILGFSNYNPDKAENDFTEYFKEFSRKKVELFREKLGFLENMRHIEYFEKLNNYIFSVNSIAGGITGSCNPFSPVIIASSEYSGEITNHWDIYFKVLYDFFWMDFFNFKDKIIDDIYKEFCKFWSGAREKHINPFKSVFYSSLRKELTQNYSKFRYEYPFMVYLTLYHTYRGGNHQWDKIDLLKKYLLDIKDKCYTSNPFFKKFKINADCSNVFNDYFQKYEPFEEYFFLTECNLIPATLSDTSKLLENNFLNYVIKNFKSPKIIILNPTQKKLPAWYKKLKKKEVRKITTKEIEIAKINNKIIVRTPNLTGRSALKEEFFKELSKILKGIYVF